MFLSMYSLYITKFEISPEKEGFMVQPQKKYILKTLMNGF